MNIYLGFGFLTATLLSCFVSCKSIDKADSSSEKGFNYKVCTATLKSKDGVQINFDFKAHWEHGYVASPLSVSVSGNGVTSGKQVAVSIVSQPTVSNHGAPIEPYEKKNVTLVFDASKNKLTKEIPNGLVLLADQFGQQAIMTQYVRVTLDGKPLTDPVNGTDTFSMVLLSAMKAQNCL